MARIGIADDLLYNPQVDRSRADSIAFGSPFDDDDDSTGVVAFLFETKDDDVEALLLLLLPL